MAIKLNVNVTRKAVYFALIIITVLAIIGGGYAYSIAIPKPGHGADTITVAIPGLSPSHPCRTTSLQEAITRGCIRNSNLGGTVWTTNCAYKGATGYPFGSQGIDCPANEVMVGGLGCGGDYCGTGLSQFWCCQLIVLDGDI